MNGHQQSKNEKKPIHSEDSFMLLKAQTLLAFLPKARTTPIIPPTSATHEVRLSAPRPGITHEFTTHSALSRPPLMEAIFPGSLNLPFVDFFPLTSKRTYFSVKVTGSSVLTKRNINLYLVTTWLKGKEKYPEGRSCWGRFYQAVI